MIVTVEDRTAYFLSKLEAMWPNRLALSVKETAETLNVVFVDFHRKLSRVFHRKVSHPLDAAG